MELAIERLLRSNTADTIIRLVAMLKTTAARYGFKRSATNLAAPWREGTRRLNKLLGSVAAWLPAGFSPDMALQFGELLKLGIAEVGGCPVGVHGGFVHGRWCAIGVHQCQCQQPYLLDSIRSGADKGSEPHALLACISYCLTIELQFSRG